MRLMLGLGMLFLLTGCEVAFGPPPTLTPTLEYDPLVASPTPDIRFPTPMPNNAVPDSAGVTQPTLAGLPAQGNVTTLADNADIFRPVLLSVQLASNQTLNAELYEAAQEAPAVLLLGDTFDSWGGFPSLLHEAGYTVMTINSRQALSASDISDMFTSLAVQPYVDATRLLAIGVEFGADSALAGCARDSRCVGAVLISPRTSTTLEAALPAFGGRPLLVAASSEDLEATNAAETVRRLTSTALIQPFEDAGIGTQILTTRPDFATLIITWLKQAAALP